MRVVDEGLSADGIPSSQAIFRSNTNYHLYRAISPVTLMASACHGCRIMFTHYLSASGMGAASYLEMMEWLAEILSLEMVELSLGASQDMGRSCLTVYDM